MAVVIAAGATIAVAAGVPRLAPPPSGRTRAARVAAGPAPEGEAGTRG